MMSPGNLYLSSICARDFGAAPSADEVQVMMCRPFSARFCSMHSATGEISRSG